MASTVPFEITFENYGKGVNSDEETAAGVDRTAPPVPGTLRVASNVQLTNDGRRLRGRYGTTRVAATGSSTVPVRYTSAVTQGKIYLFGEGSSLSDITCFDNTTALATFTAAIGTPLGVSSPIIAAETFVNDFGGEAVYYFPADVSGNYGYILNTTSAALTWVDPPLECVGAAVYNQRLIAASKDTLYWSPLNTGISLNDTSLGGGSARLPLTDAGPIRSLRAAGQYLYIIRENGIDVFSGWGYDDIQITTNTYTRSFRIGALGHSYTKVVRDKLYIVTSDAIYEVDGLNISVISLVLPIGVITGSAYAHVNVDVSIAYDPDADELLFSGVLTNAGVGNSLAVYSRRYGAWTTFDIAGNAARPTLYDGGNRGILMRLDGGDLVSYSSRAECYRDNLEYGGGTTGAVPYTMQVELDFDAGQRGRVKVLRDVYMEGDNGGSSADFGFVSTVVGDLSSTSSTFSGNTIAGRAPCGARGYRFRVTAAFTGTSSCTRFPIFGPLTMRGYYHPRRLR